MTENNVQFYIMDLEVGTPHETWCGYLKPENEGKCATCPACGVVVSSIPTLPPYGIELIVHGQAPGDFAFCPGNAIVVSSRFRIAWDTAKLRGLEFVPVERLRVRPARFGKKPLTYFHATPQRFGTKVDMKRSRIDRERSISCSHCYSGGPTNSIRGFKIDESSWTGEDMFYAWGLNGSRIVTDRVRQLREEYGLTNVHLIPTEQYFWDPLNRWTPVDYSRDDVPTPDENSDQDVNATN